MTPPSDTNKFDTRLRYELLCVYKRRRAALGIGDERGLRDNDGEEVDCEAEPGKNAVRQAALGVNMNVELTDDIGRTRCVLGEVVPLLMGCLFVGNQPH